MIYVTVGTQLPFDRLVSVINEWAAKNTKTRIVAQVGPTTSEFESLECLNFVSPSQSNTYFKDADLIVAHAGMGSVLTALKYRKPIIIFPRKASLGEHRNEHQLATARWLEGKVSVYVAWDEPTLLSMLDRGVVATSELLVSDYANEELIRNLSKFING
ncbi:glycosyltransferase [Chitinibacter tainanensis]|uniref:glycosyltransferase n=1 Tax=Chitinibacter tainanensis TaxID=230667 RepID=UPI0023551F76|nr:glycosyltransferase [Chitinibacter tainanensis]